VTDFAALRPKADVAHEQLRAGFDWLEDFERREGELPAETVALIAELADALAALEEWRP
jgi:hypothetical protein